MFVEPAAHSAAVREVVGEHGHVTLTTTHPCKQAAAYAGCSPSPAPLATQVDLVEPDAQQQGGGGLSTRAGLGLAVPAVPVSAHRPGSPASSLSKHNVTHAAAWHHKRCAVSPQPKELRVTPSCSLGLATDNSTSATRLTQAHVPTPATPSVPQGKGAPCEPSSLTHSSVGGATPPLASIVRRLWPEPPTSSDPRHVASCERRDVASCDGVGSTATPANTAAAVVKDVSCVSAALVTAPNGTQPVGAAGVSAATVAAGRLDAGVTTAASAHSAPTRDTVGAGDESSGAVVVDSPHAAPAIRAVDAAVAGSGTKSSCRRRPPCRKHTHMIWSAVRGARDDALPQSGRLRHGGGSSSSSTSGSSSNTAAALCTMKAAPALPAGKRKTPRGDSRGRTTASAHRTPPTKMTKMTKAETTKTQTKAKAETTKTQTKAKEKTTKTQTKAKMTKTTAHRRKASAGASLPSRTRSAPRHRVTSRKPHHTPKKRGLGKPRRSTATTSTPLVAGGNSNSAETAPGTKRPIAATRRQGGAKKKNNKQQQHQHQQLEKGSGSTSSERHSHRSHAPQTGHSTRGTARTTSRCQDSAATTPSASHRASPFRGTSVAATTPLGPSCAITATLRERTCSPVAHAAVSQSPSVKSVGLGGAWRVHEQQLVSMHARLQQEQQARQAALHRADALEASLRAMSLSLSSTQAKLEQVQRAAAKADAQAQHHRLEAERAQMHTEDLQSMHAEREVRLQALVQSRCAATAAAQSLEVRMVQLMQDLDIAQDEARTLQQQYDTMQERAVAAESQLVTTSSHLALATKAKRQTEARLVALLREKNELQRRLHHTQPRPTACTKKKCTSSSHPRSTRVCIRSQPCTPDHPCVADADAGRRPRPTPRPTPVSRATPRGSHKVDAAHSTGGRGATEHAAACGPQERALLCRRVRRLELTLEDRDSTIRELQATVRKLETDNRGLVVRFRAASAARKRVAGAWKLAQ